MYLNAPFTVIPLPTVVLNEPALSAFKVKSCTVIGLVKINFPPGSTVKLFTVLSLASTVNVPVFCTVTSQSAQFVITVAVFGSTTFTVSEPKLATNVLSALAVKV